MWRWPDWKFPCWHLPLSPSCIPIPKHGRHSTLNPDKCQKESTLQWWRSLPTQTSVASPQRNKSVMSSFWSSSFNMDSFWEDCKKAFEYQNRIKKWFIFRERRKRQNLFEVVKEARVSVNKRFLPLQNCLCCHWNLIFNACLATWKLRNSPFHRSKAE